MLHKIKEIAKERGMTLTQLCEQAEVNRYRISKWDIEKPSVDKVVRVARVLECSVEDLVED